MAVEVLFPTYELVPSRVSWESASPSAGRSQGWSTVGSGMNSSTYSRSSPISLSSSPVAPVISRPVLPSNPLPQHLTWLLFRMAHANASPTSTDVAWTDVPRSTFGRLFPISFCPSPLSTSQPGLSP